jgi:hypothetical protein
MQARLLENFTPGPLPHWVRLAVGSADIVCAEGSIRFVLAGAGDGSLSNAEIGDYRDRRRSDQPWRPPLRLVVRARFSHPASELGGTSGFGLWNNPFDLVTGGVLAPPNSLWFFCASPRSEMVASPGLPGNGFKAEMINGGTMPPWLVSLGSRLLHVPGLTPLLYRAAQTRVDAGAVRLDAVDVKAWHDYALVWHPSEAVFGVDGQEVMRVPSPPRVPLGFVAWMDNQVAVARPGGDLQFGLEEIAGRQWLELCRVEIEPL